MCSISGWSPPPSPKQSEEIIASSPGKFYESPITLSVSSIFHDKGHSPQSPRRMVSADTSFSAASPFNKSSTSSPLNVSTSSTGSYLSNASSLCRAFPNIAFENREKHNETQRVKRSYEDFCEDSLDGSLEIPKIIDYCPPTERFLNLPRDQAKTEYIERYNQLIDKEKVIARERQFMGTHIPLYTAYKKELLLIQILSSEISKLASRKKEEHDKVNRRIHFRDAFSKAPGGIRFQTVSDFLKMRKQIQEASLGITSLEDSSPRVAWFLIACNPHLYGNLFENSEESTLDYFVGDQSVNSPDIKFLFDEILRNAGFTYISTEQKDNYFNTLKKLLEKFGNVGVLQQLFIPFNEVNQLLYISKVLGVPDEDHPDALKTLLSIQLDPNQVKNYHTLQVRLLVSRFLDTKIDADYKSATYTGTTVEELKQIQHVIRDIAIELMNENYRLKVLTSSLKTESTLT